jgi:hypothetical protein
MAIIQTSGLITHIKGSIAGTTFQTGQAGLIARKKPSQVRSATSAQNNQRVIIASLNNYWENLTDLQRSTWSQFANYINGTGKTNRQNNSGQTGKTQFVAVNSWLLLYGKPLLVTPSFLPALPVIQPFFTSALESDNLGKTVQWFDPTQQILVTQVSLAQSNGTYKSNTGFRTLIYTPVSGSTQNWNAAYVAYFGVPVIYGSKYWVQLKVVNFVTGQMSGFSSALIRYIAPTLHGIGYDGIGTTFTIG